MRAKISAICVLAAALVCGPAAMAQDREVGASGQPLPRFISIRAEKANMRSGPGERYPILWVFVRPGLPVEVVEEYGPWRRVRDMDGTLGWMHRALLTSRRTALIIGGTRTLRKSPAREADPVFRAEEGVVARIRSCSGDWCHISIGGRSGWLPRSEIWGTYPEEEVE